MPRHFQEGLLSCKQRFLKSFGFDIAGPHMSTLLLSKNSHYLLFLRMLQLSKFGFNFHSMLTPDLLHESELGVWKAVFTHLVRMVYTLEASVVQTLDQW